MPELVNNIFQPQENPYGDRITAILQKRAQPQSYTPSQIGSATEASQYMALAGRNSGVEQILDAVIRKPQQEQMNMEYESARGLYDLFEEKRARGDKHAQALFDKISLFTGGDPEGTAMFLSELHSDPERIDPGNAYQVMTKLAGISKKTGYKPLDVKLKESQIRASDALATSRSTGGGSSGVTGYTYNIAKKALEGAGLTITPEVDLQLISLARSGFPKGATLNINGQEVSLDNIPGMTDVLESQASAESFGKKFGDLQSATVFDLPRVRTVSSQAINAIDTAISAPGLKNITGLLSTIPIIPGGERARADALLDQVGGRVFLAAYDTLKGGGQITEIEGQKAEQAIAAIGRAQSYEDVVSGLQVLRQAIIENVRTKETQATQTPEQITGDTYTPPLSYVDDIGVSDMTDEDILKAIE